MNLESGFSMLTLIYGTLVGLNVVQFFFWAYQVQRLVDKLMSRNYHEYRSVDVKPEVRPVMLPQTPDTGEFETLNELRPY